MNKSVTGHSIVAVMAILMALAVSAIADWTFDKAKKYTFTTSQLVTNSTPAAKRLVGLEFEFASSATGTTTVSRVRGSDIFLIKTSTYTTSTNGFIGRDQFDGVYFINGDILQVTDNSGVSKDMIVNFEKESN